MGGFDRNFTKSLIICDFDDVLKNPFRYVDLFSLHKLLSKKISENRHARPVTEGGHSMSNHPVPTLTPSDSLEILTKFDLTFCNSKSKILALLDK